MLVQKNIEETRAAVDELYGHYLALRGDSEDHVDQEKLALRIERLRDLSILLVVTGEVKSGKSSFVNAFLGTDLLPVGTLEMSSAVVEITHGPRNLKVTFADGSEREVAEREAWDAEVRELLTRVAAVPGDYRDLPVVHLRQFVADQQPKGVSKADVSTYAAGLSRDAATNPRSLSSREFEKRAQQFFEKLGSPDQVAVTIQLTYPLPHGSPLVRVVDTPGVNAIGSVESVTRQYLGRCQRIGATQLSADGGHLSYPVHL